MENFNEIEISKILKEFRERTGILYSNLFTADGFIIAVDQSNMGEDTQIFESIGAVYASLFALAEQGVKTINEEHYINHISIQAGNQLDSDSFMIILELVNIDIIISTIFPIFANFGVIHFELTQIIQKLNNYFSGEEKLTDSESLSTLE